MERLNDRLEVRVPKAVKARIEKAAALAGSTLSAFVTASALERAEEIFARQRTTELSDRDARRFLEILNEVEPNPRLKAAARRFKGWNA